MRRAALPAVLCMIAGTLSVSSPIFAEDSPPEEVPEAASLEEKTELPSRSDADVRALVESREYEEALDLVRRRLTENPAGADASDLRLLEARLQVRLANMSSAIRTYRRLLDDPIHAETARAELHETYVQRGDFQAADRLTAAAAEPGPGVDPADLRRRAFSLSVQGEFATAARLLAGLAEAGDGQASVLRANALLALGDQRDAEELYLKVLETEQDPLVRQVAHFGLGQVARLRGGRAVRAIQDEKAVKLGEAAWAELDWGLALRALGRRGDARMRLEKALRTNPDLGPTARLALARLDEEEGRVDDALEHLVSALEGGLADFLVWTRLGDLLLQEGQEEDGIEAYRSALALFPGFPPARDRLSRALAARGRWDEVPGPAEDDGRWALSGWTWERLLDGDLPYYETVTDRSEIPPDDPRRLVLALVQMRAGFPAGALGWADGASDPLLITLRAEALERVGRTEEAEEVLIGLLEGSESAVAKESLARIAFARDPEEGRARWAELFAANPEHTRGHVRYARLLEDEEDWAGALVAYEAASSAGWLSGEERRRIRVAREDLEDMVREEEESRADE